jgi:hypothetical protein
MSKKQVTAALTTHLVLELDGEGSVEEQLKKIKEKHLQDGYDVQVLIPTSREVNLVETVVLDLEEVSRTDI